MDKNTIDQAITAKLDKTHVQAHISHSMAIFWCVVTGLCRGGMYSSTKITQELTNIQTNEILLVRSIIIMLGAYIHGNLRGVDLSFKAQMKLPQNLKISLIKRSVYGYTAIVCAFHAIRNLPGSIAVAMMQCTAFVTAILAYLIVGDPLSYFELFAIIFGTIGCTMLTSPQLFVQDKIHLDMITLEHLENHHYQLGIFFAFLFTVLNAFKIITMSEMGNQLHCSVQTYWNGAVALICTFIHFVLFDRSLFKFYLIGTGEYPIGQNKLLGALAIGIFSWGAQESLSLGLTVIKSGTTASFFNIGLIIAFITDVFYFGRQQFWTDYTGISLIIIFTSIQGLISNSEHKEVQKEIKQESEEQQSLLK